MNVLIASFYGDPRLVNAPAQFTRSLAGALAGAGIGAAVWTGAAGAVTSAPDEAAGAEDIAGELPVTRVPAGDSRRWLADWRPSPEIREFARRELAALRPDLVVLSAWRGLSDVALAAEELGIPYLLFLHDYSILCLRSWLLDGDGELCTGPETDTKCVACMKQALGRRGRLRQGLSALPVAGPAFARALGRSSGDHRGATGTVLEARRHMTALLGGARRVIAQTPRTREILERFGVAPERIELVPQSCSQSKRLGQDRPPRPEGRPPRFAFLGRWSREKGSDLLMEAFAAADLPEGSQLWCVASNPEAVHLPPVHPGGGKRLCLFAGFGGAETSQLLSRADLVIVPSRCEDLASRAALEAMEQGVPVVVSSTVGNGYLIKDGENGRIFPSGSTEALRGILEEVGKHPEEAARWARRMPELPTPEAWSRRMVEVVQRAAQREPAP